MSGYGIYWVHYNGAAWFVKTDEMFREQGGRVQPWGHGWRAITALGIEHARVMADALYGGAERAKQERETLNRALGR